MRKIESQDSNPSKHVDVGETHIGVHQHNPLAILRQGYREIDRDITFAYATLAAGDRDSPVPDVAISFV